MKKIAVIVAVTGIIFFAIWYAQQEPPPTVTLVTVARGQVQASVSNTRAGTIKSCRRSRLSMPIGGRVAKLLVDEGDRVVSGQVLLELWNEDQQARTAQTQANLLANDLREQQACLTAKFDAREANRLTQLAARNLASEDAVDSATTKSATSSLACKAANADLKVAQASVDLQRSLLDLTILRAPFDGVIAEINGEIGEYVTPSPPGVATPPAVDLIDTSCLYVTAPIDEVDAQAIRVGLNAGISLDAFADRVFNGQLVRIAPYVLDLEKQARTVDVDVRFSPVPEDVSLLVGYSADVTIVLESRDSVLRIPTEAILEGDQVLVYNGDSGALESRSFTAGISNWNFTEVLDGLSEGERIVMSLDADGVEPGATVSPGDD